MAEIICMECKANVSDESGSCPECGYPFDGEHADQDAVVADETPETPETPETSETSETPSAQPTTVVTTPLDVILQSLGSLGLEIKALQGRVGELKHDLDSRSSSSADNSERTLTEITGKLDLMSSVQNTMNAAIQADSAQKTKKNRLAAFYKTLNSPNSMFEYMFYICVVQIVFAVVNLFLVAYIVTLVRK